jgi:triacylglycerol esterase/lipase EstA (alpha/beta hydrolase family)
MRGAEIIQPVRRRGLAVAGAAALAFLPVVCPAAGADPAYAPPSRPGPPLDVPGARLAAALQCRSGVSHAARAPVLLVPGTGASAKDNFGWNYEPALDSLKIPWCAVTFPYDGNGDIQVNGEYVAYAIRTMYALAGRRIAIVGHSQGGMVPRWALRFWPDTRRMVDDVIGFAPSNHGTTQAQFACHGSCLEADWQQAYMSNFIRALNSYQETFAGISYTNVYTHDDEIVQPNSNDTGSSSLHGGGGQIANIAVQDV